jgi:hypothetical protein
MSETVAALKQAQLFLELKFPAGGPFDRDAIAAATDYAINQLEQLGIPAPERATLVWELEQRHSISIGRESVLQDKDEDHAVWYRGERASPGPFADRYFRYLRENKLWSDAAVRSLRETTETIVGLIGDPERATAWDRRGLVVGHVQSGKTASYAGVISRSADAGYRLIIVLAGMHNALRAQTQMRLDEDFVGFESSPSAERGKLIGVSAKNDKPMVYCLTHRDMAGDFNKRRAEAAIQGIPNDPVLLVVKKNASTLKNVNAWVEEVLRVRGETERVPLLVIDDEADQASIDTRQQAQLADGEFDEDYDPTKINAQIRRLLKAFRRSSYVAYTATPFANILIHDEAVAADYGDDLFPRSFVVSLPAPSNYVGPSLLFGSSEREGINLTRPVDQIGENWIPEKHDIGFRPSFKGEDRIPPSLEDAILSFVLACAARRARGQSTRHNSMLVHVSRFKQVQAIVHRQIGAWFNMNREALELGIGADGLNERLRVLWEADFVPTRKDVSLGVTGYETPAETWNVIHQHIVPAMKAVELRTVNSDITQPLDYDRYPHGLSVIAVGGDKLSRGLTLEGLSVSYFLRASRMYDSLMQMGRWFGYRPGYLDVCRIFMPGSLREWFQHVAEAAEDLRAQLDQMAALAATPKNYGLYVQTHEVMMVTARNKSRHGEDFDLSFAGTIKIPTLLSTKPIDVANNLNATKDLLAKLGPTQDKQKLLWGGVSGELVRSFIRRFRFHTDALNVTAAHLDEFIKEQVAQGELVEWTVFLANGEGPEAPELLSARLVRRARISDERSDVFKVKTVLSPRDEAIDLNEDQYESAMEDSRIERAAKDMKEPQIPDGRFIRKARSATNGLLLIYPLEGPEELGSPLIAPVLSFPRSVKARSIKVKAGTVLRREFVA